MEHQTRNECELCKFNNPKGTVTAVIINNGKLLVLKRNEEPFKGEWDLPGGFMHEGDLPEGRLKRELKEELKDMAKKSCLISFVGLKLMRLKWLSLLLIQKGMLLMNFTKKLVFGFIRLITIY